jgi:hypothetical protein
MKFRIFRIFSDFLGPNSQKRLFFSSNGRIHIQIIKFQFKWTNQKSPRHYRSSTLATGGSVDDTVWPNSSTDGITHPEQVLAIAPDPTTMSFRMDGSMPALKPA